MKKRRKLQVLGEKLSCKNKTCIVLVLHRNIFFSIPTASPKFQLYTTKEGNVPVIQGHKNKIQCIVKSFPQSNISWETSVEISAYKMKTRKTQGKKEITTTSIFILDSPIPNHEGKGVSCVARPRYGEILRRQYTLIYKPGKKFSIVVLVSTSVIMKSHFLFIKIATYLGSLAGADPRGGWGRCHPNGNISYSNQ